ncbi:hypothetical protein GALMADRAFT_133659 [Galerina marginata CBS 339.88]|uniref:Uncharacterized protein n=1 Tax=Galerina marginata (strain CBS 339.88) TaxID=685588 RepID=A0A067TPS7_GALM3|nr:hypothetical protein GALMADRAFT_133659 [Galerina marginata CBS 339.88]
MRREFLPLEPGTPARPFLPKSQTYFAHVFRNCKVEKAMHPRLIQRNRAAGVFPAFQLIDASDVSWYKAVVELGNNKMRWDLIRGFFELKTLERPTNTSHDTSL